VRISGKAYIRKRFSLSDTQFSLTLERNMHASCSSILLFQFTLFLHISIPETLPTIQRINSMSLSIHSHTENPSNRIESVENVSSTSEMSYLKENCEKP
jgi:hypothetical protein